MAQHYIQQSVVELPLDQLKAPDIPYKKNRSCNDCAYHNLDGTGWCDIAARNNEPVLCEATVTLQVGTQLVTL